MFIEHLPIEEETVRRLKLLGLRRVEQLLAFTQEELYSQFGDEGFTIWELVRGIDERPPVQIEKKSLPEAEGDELALIPLFEDLKKQGRFCKELTVSAPPHTFVLRFSRGINDWRRAHAHLFRKLEQLHFEERPTFRFVLTATVAAEQLSLFHTRASRDFSSMQLEWKDPDSRLPERRAYLRGRPLCLPRQVEWQGSAVKVRGSWRRVERALEEWEVEEDWWEKRIQRRYYWVLLENGGRLRLFRDAQGWFHQ